MTVTVNGGFWGVSLDVTPYLFPRLHRANTWREHGEGSRWQTPREARCSVPTHPETERESPWAADAGKLSSGDHGDPDPGWN